MRCDLALVTVDAYQAHIVGENLLVVATKITVYAIALVKAHRNGKLRASAL